MGQALRRSSSGLTVLPAPLVHPSWKPREVQMGRARPSLDAADYEAAYNRVLQYPQLPLINYGNRENPMYLPAEVCVVFAGQPSKSKLDGADIVEDLTHNMCYFSSHATKAVSLCPSAYYADLASARDATWPACSIRRHHHGFILAEFH
ncbi:PAZ domain protein [Metarhizium robertsii]|uniref:PAZ domain protein n=1 Tax=Metarhizium robertsii TaxID=568076 RepID=A0A014P9K1_9HYPO|nr:PAZ domain protein [Metarhizium robertsii]